MDEDSKAGIMTMTNMIADLNVRIGVMTERVAAITEIAAAHRKHLEAAQARTESALADVVKAAKEHAALLTEAQKKLGELETTLASRANIAPDIDSLASAVSKEITRRDAESSNRTKWGQIATVVLALGAAIAQALGMATSN